MTPHSPSTIRAFYAEDEPAAAAEADASAAAAAAEAAAVDAAAEGITAERGSNGGRVSAASSSAYEVMEFQPAQPEPQVCVTTFKRLTCLTDVLGDPRPRPAALTADVEVCVGMLLLCTINYQRVVRLV
jgi:hypothetical protein